MIQDRNKWDIPLAYVPKQKLRISLIFGIGYDLFILVIVWILLGENAQKPLISLESMPIWILVGILLSLYAFSYPIGRRFRKKLIASLRSGPTPRQEWAVTFVHFGIPMLAPMIYGLCLWFMGMPVSYFYIFVGLSVASGIFWYLFINRKTNSTSQ